MEPKRVRLPRPFALLAAALALAGLSHLSPADAQKKPEWRETDAGSVPNRFGELVSVAGLSANPTLLFRNADGELRLIELGSGKISGQALVIRRVEPEKGTKPVTDKKWKEAEAGVIPASFGDLISFSGATRNYTFVFRDGEGAIRIVELRGNQINAQAKRIDRADPGSASMPKPSTPGWQETWMGAIPETHGPLVAVTGTAPQILLAFQADDGEIRLVELQGNKIANQSTKVAREY